MDEFACKFQLNAMHTISALLIG